MTAPLQEVEGRGRAEYHRSEIFAQRRSLQRLEILAAVGQQLLRHLERDSVADGDLIHVLVGSNNFEILQEWRDR